MTKTPDTSTTTVGNVFISNYPPFSFWSTDEVAALEEALGQPADPDVRLGIYVHLPFCRKRCDFCYFKVYTDKNAAQVRRYLAAVLSELETVAKSPYLANRTPTFIYFGGGTPSYLSSDQLRTLFEGMRERLPWDGVEEVAFECEPGTLQEGKAKLLRELGVTRISLGVENFDAEILELNNRAHRAVEIDRAWGFIQNAGFPQVNIDLIAGMVGETEENWVRCVDRTLELAPENVTIYQMEVPYNTTIYQRMQEDGQAAAPVADWATKRRWVSEGFDRLQEAGYTIGSAYTASKGDARFLYRDALWEGADMVALGVSSFGYLGGTHYQNEHTFDAYVSRVEKGELPVYRAFRPTDEERLIREFILQMKLGRLEPAYFQRKFGVDVRERFAAPLRAHQAAGYLVVEADRIFATREGLMRIDSLLPDYFLERHKNARYA